MVMMAKLQTKGGGRSFRVGCRGGLPWCVNRKNIGNNLINNKKNGNKNGGRDAISCS